MWGDGTRSREMYSLERDRKHRYLIEKIWGEHHDAPMAMFVMSNPSAARVDRNDPTVDICEKFARLPQNPFGGIYITNIFAFVQGEIGRNEPVDDEIGTENCRIIREYVRIGQPTIICAWGNNCCDDRFQNQLNNVKAILREGDRTLECFGIKASRNPKQPLELLGNVDIDEFNFNTLNLIEWEG